MLQSRERGLERRNRYGCVARAMGGSQQKEVERCQGRQLMHKQQRKSESLDIALQLRASLRRHKVRGLLLFTSGERRQET